MIYKILNDGKAIAIKINAGVMVQTNSIIEPCFKYLYAIGLELEL
jgi:hypothetical protein